MATEPEYFIADILTLILGIAGGVAFLLLLAGAFGYITSSGSPDAVMGAKSTITAALTGLAVIIFSVLILGLLGVNVFGLPGFSWTGNVLTTPQ
ncbi:MAG: hypothetical protein ABII16_01305 [Patescibacteria group bacterium]